MYNFKKTSNTVFPALPPRKLNASVDVFGFVDVFDVADEINYKCDQRRCPKKDSKKTYEEESQVEISQRCPSKDKLNGVIDELQLSWVDQN